MVQIFLKESYMETDEDSASMKAERKGIIYYINYVQYERPSLMLRN